MMTTAINDHQEVVNIMNVLQENLFEKIENNVL